MPCAERASGQWDETVTGEATAQVSHNHAEDGTLSVKKHCTQNGTSPQTVEKVLKRLYCFFLSTHTALVK